MNKRSKVISLFVSSFLFLSYLSISNDSDVYVNLNNVAINAKQYKNLKAIGYTDEDIQYITQDRLDAFGNIIPLHQAQRTKVIRNNKIKYKNIEGNDSYVYDNKTLSFKATWYSADNPQNQYIYCKLDLTADALNGGFHYLGIMFGSDLVGKPLNSSSVPYFFLTARYDHSHYLYEDQIYVSGDEKEEKWTKVETQNNNCVIDDRERYIYQIDKGLAAFVSIPSNFYVNRQPQDDYGSTRLIRNEQYSNFTISLEFTLLFKQLYNNYNTSLIGVFGEHVDGEKADILQFRIQATRPYVYVEYTNVNWNKAKYEEYETYVFLTNN